ncbi:uncharacterized protein KGF55_003740 [Candida pseudojiufengensis]|uniref:uncharacterized protein n=1 Tax=Candida pseudojiufengensis TaxID=497109 RepID=UPI0022242A94|nr:uncharacterized protein KGF55_003740 [Candida pseudojiufengensis]KAI5962664.1 hypothetical protein KGF55_003740 [Candida pseudojiufengensis]
MLFIFLLYWSFLSLPVSAITYYNTTTIPTQELVTVYTTVCPETTTLTLTACSNHKCNPTKITVTEPTTLTLTSILCPTTITKGGNDITTIPEPTTSTEEIEVTRFQVIDYTTVCPESTILTITRCSNERCHPSVTTIKESGTYTFTGKIIISTTVFTTETPTPTATTVTTICTSEYVIGGKPTTYTTTENGIITLTNGGFTTYTTYLTTETIEYGKPTTSTYTVYYPTTTIEVTTFHDYVTTFPKPTEVIIQTCNECHPTTIYATKSQVLSFETAIISLEGISQVPVVHTSTIVNEYPSNEPIAESTTETQAPSGVISIAGGKALGLESYLLGLAIFIVNLFV